MPADPHTPSQPHTPVAIAYATSLAGPGGPHLQPGASYQACHYLCGGRAGADLQRVAGDNTVHVDLAGHDDALFLLRGGAWVYAGDLHVDVDCYVEGLEVSSGRFSLSPGVLGEFAGVWVWNFGAGLDGRGVGSEQHGGKARGVTVDFQMATPPGLPAAPPRPARCLPVLGFEDVSCLTLTLA